MLAVGGSGLAWSRLAGRYPRIHDVTTDTDDPPLFDAVLPLRAGAKNAATYGGSDVAAMQRAAHSDIVPLDLTLTPAAAFAAALSAARAMGWALVAADSAAGRIEATATTPVFRFKDDVVVRVRPRHGGSRVDIRSVSRIGRGDRGKNASRIREFTARLHRAVGLSR